MPPRKGHQPSKTRVQKKKAPAAPEEEVPVDLPQREAAGDEEAPRRSPRPPPPDLEIQVEVHAADESAPTAAAGDQAAAVDESEEDARPVGKGKGKSKGKAIAKRDYSLEAEIEEGLLEWMAEHDEVWRRGHRLYKKRREIWAAKANELGLTVDHIMGWWKSLKDWYVRLSKVKSGQAAKKYTDREQYIINSLQFYKTQLPSTKSEPMMSLPLTSTQASRVSDSEPDSDQERAPTPLDEDLEAVERTSAEVAQSSSQTSSRQLKKRRKREVDHEEEWMKELRETMKANQQLLSQLIQEKPVQSEREAFIKYVADSLRAAPAEHYKQMKTKICAMIDSQDPAPAPEPARPAQPTSATPVLHQHQIYQQYQQQPFQQQPQQYQQQQPVQQYQQQQPVQQFQQPQQSQSQSQSNSTASGERWSAGSFTQLLQTSQEVLDGSLNLSPFSVDSQLLGGPGSNRRSSSQSQSLNTPPAPKPQRDDSDSD